MYNGKYIENLLSPMETKAADLSDLWLKRRDLEFKQAFETGVWDILVVFAGG